MDQFQHIDVQGAQTLLEQSEARLVDIRDPQSFAVAHAESAFHLTNDSIVSFMDEVEFEQPILVMCYHALVAKVQHNIWLTKASNRCTVLMVALKPGNEQNYR